MMAIMRKVINNNFYKIILWSFLFMLAVGSGFLVNVRSDKEWVVKAYDKIMSASRFNLLYKIAKQQKEDLERRRIFLTGKNVEKETVVASVSSLLGEYSMDFLQLNVPQYLVEKSVNQNLSQLPRYFFQSDGSLNEQAFSKLIAPQTIEEFLDSIKIDSKNSLFYSIVNLAVYTPLFELNLQYDVDYADKKYSVICFPLQQFLAKEKEQKISDEELENFYKKPSIHEEFKSQEKRAGIMYSFDQSDYVANITDTDIKNYYEKHKKNYLLSPSKVQIRSLVIKAEIGKEEEAKKKIESLKEKAEKDPKDFVKIIKEFSQDDGNGLSELFDQDTKELDKTVVQTAFESLSKDDQISNPIKTNKGYELIQRVKRIPAQYKELARVEHEIKKDLISNKFKQRFMQDATRVLSQANYQSDALTKFIERYKGDKKELLLDIRKNSVEMNHLFKLGLDKFATFFDGDKGIILQCTQIESSKVLPLKDVRDEVALKYHTQKAQKDLEKALKEASKDSQSMTFDEIAQKNHLKVQHATFEYKDDKLVQSPLLKSSEVQKKLKDLYRQGAVTTVLLPEEGMLLRLDEVAQRNEEAFGIKKNQLKNTLFYAKKYKVKEGFIASLYRHAKLDNKIEMKSEILQLLKEA